MPVIAWNASRLAIIASVYGCLLSSSLSAVPLCCIASKPAAKARVEPQPIRVPVSAADAPSADIPLSRPRRLVLPSR